MSLRSRAGVTFMEVVSVIAIIAVVAAILFPVFQKVRESPHHGSCASDMKQIGIALTQYTQDSDDSFPAGTNAAGNGWAGELYPFIKSTGVYHCPNDIQDGAYVSYAENRNLVKQNNANLTNPTATVVLYEFTTELPGACPTRSRPPTAERPALPFAGRLAGSKRAAASCRRCLLCDESSNTRTVVGRRERWRCRFVVCQGCVPCGRLRKLR